MSLKQNILKEFQEINGIGSEIYDGFYKMYPQQEAENKYLSVISWIESKLSLIEQEVRKCVPEKLQLLEDDDDDHILIVMSHNTCRMNVLLNLDKLFNE